MTLKSMILKMQTGTSDWLALDVSELFFFFFSPQCLSLMTLHNSMSKRTEVHESQEHADLSCTFSLS